MRADRNAKEKRTRKKKHVKSFDLNNLKSSTAMLFNNKNLKSADFWLLAVVLGLVVLA